MAWAVPALLQMLHRAKIKRVINDLNTIQFSISSLELDKERLPDSLDDLPTMPPVLRTDAWGNPYQYLSSADPSWAGKSRKDQFIVPLNTDYDLYSVGPDGDSKPPLTAPQSRDDIGRANNGAFIGPASEF